ncbi:putative quinol monooxygenase [Streptomyces sp. Y7]|uniref:putative quinol monooxygenase n=1 Tax=Streptomyces sp. Y7 TaxID=3342392 RepID=UPI00371583AF
MTATRVLHQLTDSENRDAELIEHVQRVRKEAGCTEAECYRSALDPQKVAIVELWQDQYAYGDYWTRVLSSADPGPVLRSASSQAQGESASEFYRHQYFYPDPVWVAAGHKDRTQKIFWPAGDGVRVIIQTSMPNVDAALPALLENMRETQREPGCLQFELLRSIEFPNHILLLELWPSQQIFDAHWQLRMKVGSDEEAPEPAPRQQGSNGMEFYRHQPFQHLYDRWMPAEVTKRSETVIWPD